MEQRAKIVESGGEEFVLGGGEVAAGFADEHIEGVDHGLGGAEVDLLFAGVRIGDLAKEKPGILGLEDDEFVEPGIGFRRCWHGGRIGTPGGLYKWEDGPGGAFRPQRQSPGFQAASLSFALQG